jgi:replicative DNA helicase
LHFYQRSTDIDYASHDNTAEQCVLGALLLGDKSTLGAVTSIVSSRDFYQQHHQQIFEAIICLADKGETVDLLTVHQELVHRGIFEQIGGFAFLLNLFDNVPTTLQAADHAKTIHLCALWRRS